MESITFYYIIILVFGSDLWNNFHFNLDSAGTFYLLVLVFPKHPLILFRVLYAMLSLLVHFVGLYYGVYMCNFWSIFCGPAVLYVPVFKHVASTFCVLSGGITRRVRSGFI